ncbi:hypothetical protein AURDEDRAFT_168025 [Auricularia subglabra TFB-10046 SS5]|nr:hypothetical protein AURDEDRAFT_168025 [Auricularia subglabra TFB-10046 SS5]
MSAPTAAMTQSWYRSVIAGLTYASYRGGDTSEAPSLGALSDEKSVCTDMPARCIAECSSSSSVLTDCARSDVSALGAISRLDGCGAVELDASAVPVVIEYGIASAVEGSSRGRRRLRRRRKTSKAPAARIEATTGTTIATISFDEARGEVAVDDVVELDGVAWGTVGDVWPSSTDIEDEACARVGELGCALDEEDEAERSPKLPRCPRAHYDFISPFGGRMATWETSARTLAPVFWVRKTRSTDVVLPVELVLYIVRLAATSDARAARALAFVCRNIYPEVDKLRFRVLHWRRPQQSETLASLCLDRGPQFLLDNVRSIYWDWSPSKLSRNQLSDVDNCIARLRHNPSALRLRLSTVVLNIDIVEKFWRVPEPTVLEELMIVYDPCRSSSPNLLQLPYEHLTRLLLRNFPVGWWPEEAVFYCRTLTHLSLDVLHEQDEVTAQEDAVAIWWFTSDALKALPALKCFLLVLLDDGDVPQFKNTDIYADTLRDIRDGRVRIDFDTTPCDWHKRWWRSRTQEGETWNGRTDFWETGCTVPDSLRLAKPPLSHFLRFPSQ